MKMKRILTLIVMLCSLSVANAQDNVAKPHLSAFTRQYLQACKDQKSYTTRVPDYVYKQINGKAYISAFNQGEDTVRLKSLDGTTTEVVDSFDGYCWAVEDAEQFLNDSVAPAGSSFGWYDGEFYLWSQKEWEETV